MYTDKQIFEQAINLNVIDVRTELLFKRFVSSHGNIFSDNIDNVYGNIVLWKSFLALAKDNKIKNAGKKAVIYAEQYIKFYEHMKYSEAF